MHWTIARIRISHTQPNKLIFGAPSVLHLIETLDISDNSLTGIITDDFQSMVKLTNLLIDSNELGGTVEDVLNCGECMSTMQLFRSRYNPFSGSIPPSLFEFSQLSSFQLSRSDVSGTISPEFGMLTNLELLDLSFNPFFDPGTTIPSEIGMLTKLERLYFAGSSISGTVPSELGSLRRLEQLLLAGTYLIGTIPESICDIETLQVIIHSPDLICDCPGRQNMCRGPGKIGNE